MTAQQFAKEQCSNYTSSGGCDGVGIKDDGRLFGFGKKPKCVLSVAGQRWAYFEECVLPMGFDDPKKRQQVADMKADYLHSVGVVHKGRVCPQCEMRILEPRRRLCGQYTDKNRKAARNANRIVTKEGSDEGN